MKVTTESSLVEVMLAFPPGTLVRVSGESVATGCIGRVTGAVTESAGTFVELTLIKRSHYATAGRETNVYPECCEIITEAEAEAYVPEEDV